MTVKLWPERPIDGLMARIRGSARVEPHIEYQTRPLDWIEEKLEVPRDTIEWSLHREYAGHQWDGTRDPLVVMLEALAAGERVIGVESGTATGKTFLAACVSLWFCACWRGSRVFTIASRGDQLKLNIWKEFSDLWPRFARHFPRAQKLGLSIRMEPPSEGWGIHGFIAGVRAEEVEGSAVKAQGLHAEHMLVIHEEMAGNHPAIVKAIKNTSRAPHNIRLGIGNPDHQHDELHKLCVEPGAIHVRISALDHPNVVTGDASIIPGAVSREAIEEAEASEAEGASGRLYRSRIRGISPAEAAAALIRRAWVEEAIARGRDLTFMQPAIRAYGVDVANSEAGDKAAWAEGIGACCLQVRAFACPDANLLGLEVHTQAEAEGVLSRRIGVDKVGVGAGTVNELKRLGRLVAALGGGDRPIMAVDEDWRYRERKEDDDLPTTVLKEEIYANFRSQMWWQARDDLQHGRISIREADDELVNDLTTPTYDTPNGKITVKSKEDIKKDLGRSPNKGDAFVYWNWVRRRKPVKQEEPKVGPNHDKQFERVVARLNRSDRKAAKARKLKRWTV